MFYKAFDDTMHFVILGIGLVILTVRTDAWRLSGETGCFAYGVPTIRLTDYLLKLFNIRRSVARLRALFAS